MNNHSARVIAHAREAKGMTQSELARALGVTPQAVQKWEAGTAVPRPTKFQRVAEVLGIEPIKLIPAGDERTQSGTPTTGLEVPGLGKMKTNEEIRRANARRLAAEIGSAAELARRLAMSDSQLGQLIGKNPVRNIGTRVARRIEAVCGRPEGWLDIEHSSPDDIADRIDLLMQERNIRSQSALSRASGVPQPTIARILNKQNIPETATVTRLATALRVPAAYLLDGINGVASHPEVTPVVAGSPTLATWIIEARTRAQLTQQQLADALGVTKSNVSAWENSRHDPSWSQMLKIRAVTGAALPIEDARPAPVEQSWPFSFPRAKLDQLSQEQIAQLDKILAAAIDLASEVRPHT